MKNTGVPPIWTNIRKTMKFLTICSAVCLAVLAGCSKKQSGTTPDASFSRYVLSYTSGEISVESAVTVQLAELIGRFEAGNQVPQDIFRIKPEVKGETAYLSGGTLRFRPAAPLQPGTTYTVTLDLDRIISWNQEDRNAVNVTEDDNTSLTDLTSEQEPNSGDRNSSTGDIPEPKPGKFRFSFTTISQNYSFSEDGLLAGTELAGRLMSWSGTLITADVADPALVKQMVTASYDGRPVNLKMTHTPGRRSFSFLADSLPRHETTEKTLTIRWNGKPLRVDRSGELEAAIPPLNQFRVLSVKPQHTPGQQVVITFSDPLQAGQAFEGMATISGQEEFTWQADGNRLILFPAGHLSGPADLTLFRGIKSAGGIALAENHITHLAFRNQKPAVRLLGKGVIVPSDGKLSFPFEAVSLKAVDLRIIKIYASNIRQFLQENTLEGSSDIKKTGRLVYSGKVDLLPDNPDKLHEWSTYRIDLNRYIALEQGAIYRVELRIRKSYSLYECADPGSTDTYEESDQDGENWDAPGWYSLYYWPRGFDWQQRENPCHVSYYTSDRFVSRNIFASNLGIIAKEGKGNHFTFAVTDINTTQPQEKVTITLYDYQHQPMGRTTTGNLGMASITLTSKPFVAVAVKGNQTGYLRLDDGTSLSLSSFDVSGQELQEGIKGFIYGERGVWRPGDKLFITFILDDPEKKLPANTPIIFKLINSRGQEVNRQVATNSENGFYHFPVATQPDDPTGSWYARVQVGGATFESRIRIESVKPNRLKIDLKLPETILPDQKQQATLSAAWLHGATAPGLKAIIETEMFEMKTTFKGYEKFSFNNPGAVFFPSKQTLFEGKLDNRGNATIPLNLQAGSGAPGKLKAWFTTRVFEEGGDFSINVQNTEFSPYKKYLGVKMPDSEDGWYKTDTAYEAELVALTPDGKPAPIGNVEVSLYKIEWRWWWESGEDHLAHYVSGRHFQPVQQWHINEAGNKTGLKINVAYRDWRDNGRYLLYIKDVQGGHASGTTFYMSEWGGWRNEDMPDGAAILTLSTDKTKYAPGEKIRVRMPSSAGGRALVSLENGRQVRDIFWVETKEKETTFEIDVKEGMAPTLYIHISLLQPYGNLRNDAPVRLYGVTGVTVEDPKTVLQPVIQVKEELEPEKEFTVTVREQTGRKMTYTLAIVDEGLLDLTNFGTPNAHSHFYSREALGVRTYDLFDYIAGAYGARLEKAFAVGGDQDKVASGKKQANRFEPVVLYAGPFTVSGKGSRTHTFRMPNYVGSVRAMVVAGDQGAYGKADKDIKVRKAVMLLGTLPRVASPGEDISVPVSVFAMKPETKEVNLDIETNNLLTIDGRNTQTLTFSEPGEKTVWFRIKTNGQTGIAKIKLTGRSGQEMATWQTELEIRNPNPPVTRMESRLLEPGQSWEAFLGGQVMEPGASGWLELGTMPGLNLSKHLEELIQYPYGCTEQITSGALAQLYLDHLVRLNPEEEKRREENIRSAILRLRNAQLSGGGFSSWPGQNNADDWSSSYAGHFITLASQKGFAVQEDMKNRWLAWQRSKARDWKTPAGADPFIRQQETLQQAYRLYTLALAGSPETGVMNRFREETAGYPMARWRLAAAYLLAGQPAAAAQLLQNTEKSAATYPHHGPTFGSQLRDKAMILETLILQNDRQNAFLLTQEMAQEVSESSWLSTQTAAWSLYSMAKFFGSWTGDGAMEARVTINGRTGTHSTELPMVRIPVTVDKQGTARANLQNTGKTPLFARLAIRGVPSEITAESTDSNLEMTVTFTDRNGNRLDPANLKQGTDLTMSISVRNPGTRGIYRHLALPAIIPSGWEILNRRHTGIPEDQSPHFDYQDIRDDRVNTFFSLNAGESKTFRIMLNAAYEGRFLFPGLTCGAMYDPSVYSVRPGMWVTVTR
ncbi:MAG: MG2 domain-containing protein [Bacteroidota bacterium]